MVCLDVSRRLYRGWWVVVLWVAGAGLASAQETPLNDTGQIDCYDGSASLGTVSPATPDPEPAGFNEQDCTRGAAAADALGRMVKMGGSSAPGRDYTKIANDGSELPASATLGSGPGDWACTRDNITGLIWEIKVNDAAALRHQGHGYAWYDTDPAINGGNAGSEGTTLDGARCGGTLVNCNTSAFRDAVNALSGSDRLCGATDWRLPTGKALQSLVHYGASAAPYIDSTWFPNTMNNIYWSGTTVAQRAFSAWGVIFTDTVLRTFPKTNGLQVRLVRGGQ